MRRGFRSNYDKLRWNLSVTLLRRLALNDAGFEPNSQVPEGFAIERVDTSGAAIVIAIRAMSTASPCQACASPSLRVLSRYRRRLTDLPVGGRVMQLTIIARRLYCAAVLCGRRIFTERFKELAPWARRTVRLDTIIRHLGLALGGRPAANFAGRLMVPVSNEYIAARRAQTWQAADDTTQCDRDR